MVEVLRHNTMIWDTYLLQNDYLIWSLNTSTNTHHYVCVCLVRTFRIYSLSNFQVQHAVLLTIVNQAVPQILRTYSSYSRKFVPFGQRPCIPSNPTPRPQQPPIYFLFLWGQLSQILRSSEIIQYLLFFFWLPSLSIMPSGSIHVVPNGRTSFFVAE